MKFAYFTRLYLTHKFYEFKSNYRRLLLKCRNVDVVMSTHHVVDVLPVVEGNELEGGEHGPEEVVEIGVAVVRVLAHAYTHGCRRTAPVNTACSNKLVPHISHKLHCITRISMGTQHVLH